MLSNMYSDKWCRHPVQPSTNLSRDNSPQSYYGWMTHEYGANICVKSGEYDDKAREFCLVFPLTVDGDTMRVNKLNKKICLPKFTDGTPTAEQLSVRMRNTSHADARIVPRTSAPSPS